MPRGRKRKEEQETLTNEEAKELVDSGEATIPEDAIVDEKEQVSDLKKEIEELKDLKAIKDALLAEIAQLKVEKEDGASEHVKAKMRWEKEKEDFQKMNKVVEKWFERRGDKLVRMIRKATGNVYSQYVGNVVKEPRLLKYLKKDK